VVDNKIICYFCNETIKLIHMKIFFSDSLCRRCPYGHMNPCLYKKVFYRHLLPPYSGKKAVHKCEFYRNLFFKGQYVIIDLYHKVRDRDFQWEYVMAYKNVPGRISGLRNSKYTIELLEPYFLQRKNGVRLFLRASQPAKMIRPFPYDEYEMDNVAGYTIASKALMSVTN